MMNDFMLGFKFVFTFWKYEGVRHALIGLAGFTVGVIVVQTIVMVLILFIGSLFARKGE